MFRTRTFWAGICLVALAAPALADTAASDGLDVETAIDKMTFGRSKMAFEEYGQGYTVEEYGPAFSGKSFTSVEQAKDGARSMVAKIQKDGTNSATVVDAIITFNSMLQFDLTPGQRTEVLRDFRRRLARHVFAGDNANDVKEALVLNDMFERVWNQNVKRIRSTREYKMLSQARDLGLRIAQYGLEKTADMFGGREKRRQTNPAVNKLYDATQMALLGGESTSIQGIRLLDAALRYAKYTEGQEAKDLLNILNNTVAATNVRLKSLYKIAKGKTWKPLKAFIGKAGTLVNSRGKEYSARTLLRKAYPQQLRRRAPARANAL